jgi:murein DD-endopeptidase MepM/ murein hydrolase activator NlpD
MRDFLKFLLETAVPAVCFSLVFPGAIHPHAEGIQNRTEHWIWPAGGEITDTYGTRQGLHKGIDIASGLGAPIYAVDGGVITKSYYSDTYGHVIFIQHDNHFETVYAHLHKRHAFKGDVVKQGELIGEMGNTGDSSGVHLHFEVHQQQWTYSKENAVDPDMALGATKIGQAVIAQSRLHPDGSIETAGKLQSEEKDSQSYKNASIYIVSGGDTLTSISRKTGASITSIMTKNNLRSDLIQVGQELKID